MLKHEKKEEEADVHVGTQLHIGNDSQRGDYVFTNYEEKMFFQIDRHFQTLSKVHFY